MTDPVLVVVNIERLDIVLQGEAETVFPSF